MDTIRETLDSWLGEPKRSFSDGRVTLVYRVLSDEGFPLKLKIEINSREHFSILGFRDYVFTSNSSWASGSTIIMVKLIKFLEITTPSCMTDKQARR